LAANIRLRKGTVANKRPTGLEAWLGVGSAIIDRTVISLPSTKGGEWVNGKKKGDRGDTAMCFERIYVVRVFFRRGEGERRERCAQKAKKRRDGKKGKGSLLCYGLKRVGSPSLEEDGGAEGKEGENLTLQACLLRRVAQSALCGRRPGSIGVWNKRKVEGEVTGITKKKGGKSKRKGRQSFEGSGVPAASRGMVGAI